MARDIVLFAMCVIAAQFAFSEMAWAQNDGDVGQQSSVEETEPAQENDVEPDSADTEAEGIEQHGSTDEPAPRQVQLESEESVYSSLDRHIRGLSSTSMQDRIRAVQALGDLGDPAAVEPLVRLARSDPSPEVRAWALRMVHPFGTPEAISVVEEAELRDIDERVRETASVLLGHAFTGGPQIRDREGARESRGALLLGPRSRRRRNVGMAFSVVGGLFTAIGMAAFGFGTADTMMGSWVAFPAGAGCIVVYGLPFLISGSIMLVRSRRNDYDLAAFIQQRMAMLQGSLQ